MISIPSIADAKDIAELFIQLGYTMNERDIESKINNINNINNIVVYKDHGRVVGCIGYHIVSPFHEPSKWCIISSLVTDDRHRSRGIGRRLLQHVDGECIKCGCSHIELSCSLKRESAHRFYEKNGFNERRKRYFRLVKSAQQDDAPEPATNANPASRPPSAPAR